MGEVTNELMLEHLKAIPRQLADLRDEMREQSAVQRAMLDHIAGLIRFETHQSSVKVSLRERIERLERRLEITD